MQELQDLAHPERTQRMVALGRAAKTDPAVKALLDQLWATEGDAGAYARRLVLKSCYGSRDGARVLALLSDPSRLLRGGARKLVALCCDDAQATQALQTTWYVRQHLPLLARLWTARRLAAIDAFLDWLAQQPGDTRIADCVPYGSRPAIERHLAAALRPDDARWRDASHRARSQRCGYRQAAAPASPGRRRSPPAAGRSTGGPTAADAGAHTMSSAAPASPGHRHSTARRACALHRAAGARDPTAAPARGPHRGCHSSS